MSVINPRSMEVHLLTICERIIRLDDYESGVNTKHLNNICKFLCKEMRENNEMFDQLFESIVPAGSYPDNLKISEPDEYDLLIVLKFPSSSVAPSRPGYVTIKIIDDVHFERFVDEEGYLIQNKVLDWIRGVVRSTLMEHNNVIDTDENSYRVYQSSNGPAVTLEVTVVEQNHITFSIDFVGCLAFHSDKWWMADVRKGVGVWNAIPKPIKLNDNVTIQQRIDSKEDVMDNKLPEASNESDKLSALCTDDGSKMQKRSVESPSENKKGGKVKRPPPFLRYKRPKNVASGERETVTVDYPNRNSRSRFEKPSAVKLNMGAKVDVEEKSRWEKSVKINPSGVTVTKCRPWYRRRTKKIISESKVKEATAAQIGNQKKPSLSVNVINNHQSNRQQRKPKAMDNAEVTGDRQGNSKAVDSMEATGDRKRKSVNQKRKRAKNAPETKQKVREVTIIANPQKNREWICSYAAIEREFLKGTHNMKPLIRIFKKVRDNKQLTNLKSYFIKIIFLHQNDKNGKDYWKQSLAVLFMEMFDVILNYLSAHRLDSFWHKDFNLFRSFREGQLMAMYNNLLKMKNDLISNLEDDNPDFIYEVVCTEEERWKLDV